MYFGMRYLGRKRVSKLTDKYIVLDGTKIFFGDVMLFEIQPVKPKEGASTEEEMKAITDNIPETLEKMRQEEQAFRDRVAANRNRKASLSWDNLPDEIDFEQLQQLGGLGAIDWAASKKARNA